MKFIEKHGYDVANRKYYVSYVDESGIVCASIICNMIPSKGNLYDINASLSFDDNWYNGVMAALEQQPSLLRKLTPVHFSNDSMPKMDDIIPAPDYTESGQTVSQRNYAGYGYSGIFTEEYHDAQLLSIGPLYLLNHMKSLSKQQLIEFLNKLDGYDLNKVFSRYEIMEYISDMFLIDDLQSGIMREAILRFRKEREERQHGVNLPMPDCSGPTIFEYLKNSKGIVVKNAHNVYLLILAMQDLFGLDDKSSSLVSDFLRVYMRGAMTLTPLKRIVDAGILPKDIIKGEYLRLISSGFIDIDNVDTYIQEYADACVGTVILKSGLTPMLKLEITRRNNMGIEARLLFSSTLSNKIFENQNMLRWKSFENGIFVLISEAFIRETEKSENMTMKELAKKARQSRVESSTSGASIMRSNFPMILLHDDDSAIGKMGNGLLDIFFTTMLFPHEGDIAPYISLTQKLYLPALVHEKTATNFVPKQEKLGQPIPMAYIGMMYPFNNREQLLPTIMPIGIMQAAPTVMVNNEVAVLRKAVDDRDAEIASIKATSEKAMESMIKKDNEVKKQINELSSSSVENKARIDALIQEKKSNEDLMMSNQIIVDKKVSLLSNENDTLNAEIQKLAGNKSMLWLVVGVLGLLLLNRGTGQTQTISKA